MFALLAEAVHLYGQLCQPHVRLILWQGFVSAKGCIKKKNLPVHVKRWRTRETQWKCTMRMHQIGKSVPGLQLTYTFIGVCCQPHRERVTIFTPNLKHDTFMRYRWQVETGEQWNSVPLLSSDNKKKLAGKWNRKVSLPVVWTMVSDWMLSSGSCFFVSSH